MDTLENTLFQHLGSVCSESRQAFDRYTGMSQTRRQLLTLLLQQGELRHATLQEQLALDGATVTRLVKQFEAKGILNRRLDPQNNRYTLVALTESGHKLVTELGTEHSAFQTQLLDGITREEQQKVLQVLERLQSNIRNIKEHD